MRSRSGILAGRWLGGAVVALLAVGGVLAAAGPARADSGPGAGLRMAAVAAVPQATVKTVQAQYSCEFSGYGSGIAPATIATAYGVPDSWPVNNPMPIELDTDTLALPSQVTNSPQFSSVTSFHVEATVPAQHASAATATVEGDSTDTLPTPVTQVPQITSVGQVTFTAQGTGTVKLPPTTLVITPFAGSTGKPSINCTTTTTAQDVSIAVGKATGSFYKCTLTAPGLTAFTVSGLLNITITASGKRTVGTTDTVTLSSSDLADLVTALKPPSGVKAAFSGSLPVTGAQSGSLKLTSTSTTPLSGPLKATGKLRLSEAGTVHLLLPQTLTITLTGSVKYSCALQTSPAPAALTMSVTKASGSGGSHNGSSGNNAGTTTDNNSTTTTTTGSGTPVGAPATGGGLGLTSGNRSAAAGASAALMAAGAGLLLWARRRRGGEQLAGGLWRARRRRSS